MKFFIFEQKEYFGRFNIFLGEKKTLESIFLGENFSISENNLIAVEAAKVLTMYGISHDASSTKAWLEPTPTFDHG